MGTNLYTGVGAAQPWFNFLRQKDHFVFIVCNILKIDHLKGDQTSQESWKHKKYENSVCDNRGFLSCQVAAEQKGELISTRGKSKQKLSFPIIRTGQHASALPTMFASTWTYSLGLWSMIIDILLGQNFLLLFVYYFFNRSIEIL